MKKQLIFILIFVFALSSSCQKDDAEFGQIDSEAYQQLRVQLKNGFSEYAKYTNGAAFRNSNNNFNSEFWSYFDINFKKESYLKDNFEIFSKMSQSRIDFLIKIGYYLRFSESKEDFLSTLDSFYSEILDANLNADEKNFQLTYVIIFQESINYFEEIIPDNTRVKGWWKSWGRCAVGIIGSGITGAATVGFAGAAAGATVGSAAAGVGAVPGAAVGGAIGALAGGVGGALLGAATFCEEQEEIQNPSLNTVVFDASNFRQDQFLISQPTTSILRKITVKLN